MQRGDTLTDIETSIPDANAPQISATGTSQSSSRTNAAIQSLHTHDTSGTVHMESSVARTFTLGDFFDVWGVRFTPSCLGAYCNDGNGNTLQVFVNGQEQTSDPTLERAHLAVRDHVPRRRAHEARPRATP